MRLEGDDPLDVRPRAATPDTDADDFERAVDVMRVALAAVDDGVLDLAPHWRTFVETMREAIARYDADEDDLGGEE